jgi:hypothetical protein
MFTNKEESKFFTKSEYNHIGYKFNFDALADITSKEFADEIKKHIGFCHIKKFTFEDKEDHIFLYFYAEEVLERDFVIIHAYHNKGDYHSIDAVKKSTFDKLGLFVGEE